MNQQQLSRRLGTTTATMVIVASMVGTGIFGTAGIIQQQVQSPLIVSLLWLLGGLIAMSGALCYAELAARYPESGGEYIYIRKLFGPLPSFLSGWISVMVAFAAPAAISALLAVDYGSAVLAYFSPTQSLAGAMESHPEIVATLIIVFFSLCHMRGVGQGGVLQNILTGCKLLLLLAFIFSVFFHNPQRMIDQLTHNIATGEFSWQGLGPGLLLVMFSYSGWNAACYLGGEVKNPTKTLPKALFIGSLIVITLYLLLNCVFYGGASLGQVSESKAIAVVIGREIFADRVQLFFNGGFTWMLFAGISAYTMIGPRVSYAMAQDGLFFKIAGEIHPTRQTPINSIIIQALIAIAYIWVGSYEQILTYLGFALSLFPVLTVFGLLREKWEEGDKISSPYRTPMGWLLPIFFCTTNLLMMFIAFLAKPWESAAALLILSLGIPLYFWLNKGKSLTPKTAALLPK